MAVVASTFWTDASVARMKEMLAAGASAREAATELGCSRNAVISKAGQLHLDFVRRPFGQPGHRRRRRSGTRNGGAVVAALRARAEAPELVAVYADAAADLQIPAEQRRTLFELTSKTCRWPVGEGASLFFCGGPSAGTYCAGHQARAGNGFPRLVGRAVR